MNRPKVSIIIPIYNVEAYLRECLNSVIAQTESDWECIMIDDASTDSSAAIARNFCASDPRFRLLTHPENRGLSEARNSGLDVVTADKVTFLDSDDLIAPSFLAKGLEADADIACFGFNVIGKDNTGFRAKTKTYDSKTAITELLYQKNHVNGSAWGKIFKSTLFDGLRFTPGITYEDLDIIDLVFSKANLITASTERLYFYRKRPGSIINTWNPRRLDVLNVTERIEQRLAGDPQLLKAARDRRFAANFNMLLLLRKNGLNNSREADECRTQIRQLRLQTLLNPQTRLKNKLGALASYLFRF